MLKKEGHALCRLRHQRRGIRAGARLLSDDRRREGRRQALGADIQEHRAGDQVLASTQGRSGASIPAEQGYLHCGPAGAGHFVKMVHNGIEYGMMAAYAEGLNILKHDDVGLRHREQDAETTPLRDPEAYQYQIDIGQVAEVWRLGSVVASWLLDLTAAALVKDSEATGFSGRVSDSGEGHWRRLTRACRRP